MCILIIGLVLIQRGKGGLGAGYLGSSNQMLFGSSGGQDIFQKTTWILCAILLGGSLILSISKARYTGRSVSYNKNMAQKQAYRPSGEPNTEESSESGE
jgi:protein translocase SecG subunit